MWTRIEQQAQEEIKRKKEKKEEAPVHEKIAKTGEAAEERGKEVQNVKEDKIPDWLEKYIIYKFNLYDRTGISQLGNSSTNFRSVNIVILWLLSIRVWHVCVIHIDVLHCLSQKHKLSSKGTVLTPVRLSSASTHVTMSSVSLANAFLVGLFPESYRCCIISMVLAN